jgi:ribonuclease T2
MRIILLFLLSFLVMPANAQRRLGGEPGKFDFYVLALSWSPSFCEGRERRGMQCAGDKPFSFVVHGLWPQFTKGFPEFCAVPAPDLDRRTVSSMLDIMPAPNLVKHEWEKHGTCSGLTPYAYFENVRKARAAVKIPAKYENPQDYITVSPQELEEDFIKVNPTLKHDMIAVQCNRQRVSEIRVCMGKDFRFISCEETDRRACKTDKITLPPARRG